MSFLKERLLKRFIQQKTKQWRKNFRPIQFSMGKKTVSYEKKNVQKKY